MHTTPFKKITVGDICAEAMINKMTFYKHYSDKYELLNDVLLNIKQAIVTRIKTAAPSADVTDSGLDLTFRTLDAVIDECVARKQLLCEVSHDDMVITMISTTIEKSVYELLCDLNENHTFKYRLDMLSAAVTGAATFLIKYWLTHEQTSSKEKFIDTTKEFLRDLFASKILFE